MIPYQPFSDHLKKLGIIVTPGELHAHISGMLTMNHTLSLDEWVKIVISDFCIGQSIETDIHVVLSALYDYAKEKLQSEDYTFNLLMPADSVPLNLRLECLASWCSHYLSSLAMTGMSSMDFLSKDSQGFIEDLEKISRVDNQAEGTVGEEADYMELTEYVRAGVIMLYHEIQEQRPVTQTIQ